MKLDKLKYTDISNFTEEQMEELLCEIKKEKYSKNFSIIHNWRFPINRKIQHGLCIFYTKNKWHLSMITN